VEQTRTTQPARFFDVVLSDGTRRSASLVGNDPAHDVAVLKVDGGLPAQATLADSSSVPLGAPVVAIGSPGILSRGGSALLQNTITSGVVSGKDRALPRADLRNNVQLTDLIQTDAAINPGNSGGPLVWVATKQVIGLNTLVVRGSGEEGLGFAVSSDTVRSIASQLIARGAIR
jgi:serine protease Do